MLAPSSRSRSGATSLYRTLALGIGAAAAAVLMVFHARLLWLRVSGGSILDSSVGLRWGLSALLLGAVLALGRRAMPLPNGRQALVFWLLVAALHWNVAPPETPQPSADSKSAVGTLFLLPAAGVGFAFGTVLALLFLSRQRPAPVAPRFESSFVVAPALRDGWGLVLAPRPPPA